MMGIIYFSLSECITEQIKLIKLKDCLITSIKITFFLINWWLLPFIYLFWIWVLDKDTPKRGGRRIEFLRSLFVWKCLKHYFPIRVHKLDETELDPNRNYLFCSFPHGIMSMGAVTAFSTRAGGFHRMFPHHKPHLLTLKQFFLYPILRDLLLAMGLCSASANSINWLMNRAKGGNVAVLVVGGAEECFHCRPNNYCLVLKSRKGFVRKALKNGCPLVPVFAFGETEIYSQLRNPKGSFVRYVQEKVKWLTGYPPVVPIGCNSFLFPFIFIPRSKPINIIIGKPIEVAKIENPTEDDIDALHQNFIQQLNELFETKKCLYLKNANRISLKLV